MKMIFNIFLSLFTLVFILVALLLLVSTFKLPFFPLDARSVLTGSMEPAIETGSVVFVYPQESYGEGDVITFKPDGSENTISITHRIIAVSETEEGRVFTTKGDANQLEDTEPVLQKDVYGKVIFHIPYIGKLLDVAKTPWGFAALVIIPAVLVIVDEVKKIMVQIKGKKEEEVEEVEKREE